MDNYRNAPEFHSPLRDDARELFLAGKVLGDSCDGRFVTKFFERNPDLEAQAVEWTTWHAQTKYYLIRKK